MENRLAMAGDVDDLLPPPHFDYWQSASTVDAGAPRPTDGVQASRLDAAMARFKDVEGVDAYRMQSVGLVHSAEQRRLLVLLQAIDGGGKVGAVYVLTASGGMALGASSEGVDGTTAFDFDEVPADEEYLLVVDRRGVGSAPRDYMLTMQFDSSWSQFDGKMWDVVDGRNLGNPTVLSLSQDRNVSLNWSVWVGDAPSTVGASFSLWDGQGNQAYASSASSGDSISESVSLAAGVYRLDVRAVGAAESQTVDVSHAVSAQATAPPPAPPIGAPSAEALDDPVASPRDVLVSPRNSSYYFASIPIVAPGELEASEDSSESWIAAATDDVLEDSPWRIDDALEQAVLAHEDRFGDPMLIGAAVDFADAELLDAFFESEYLTAEGDPEPTVASLEEATISAAGLKGASPWESPIDGSIPDSQPLMKMELASGAVAPVVLAPEPASRRRLDAPAADDSNQVSQLQAAAGAALGGWAARQGHGRRVLGAFRRRWTSRRRSKSRVD